MAEEKLPPSPCVRDCCLDRQNVCLGCFRTLDEIVGWHSADAAGRREILARCEQRRAERKQRRVAPRD